MGFYSVFTPDNINFWGTDEKESNLYTYTYIPPTELDADKMSLFIPTGAIEIAVTINVSLNITRLGYVSRFQNTPSGDFINDAFVKIPWEKVGNASNGDSLIKMINNDVYVQVTNGGVHIIPHTTFEKPLGDTLSGWLNMKLLKFESGVVNNLQYQLKVNKANYLNWVSRSDFDADSNVAETQPVGTFMDGALLSKATKLTSNDIYPRYVEQFVSALGVNYCMYSVSENIKNPKVTVIGQEYGVQHHLNVELSGFLSNDEIQIIRDENLGELSPSVTFDDWVQKGNVMYITVVNLSNIDSTYKLYIQPS